MKILSVNAGLSRTDSQQGRTIETAIGQSLVAGTVRVRALNLQGDCQPDLTAANINRLYTIEKSDFATMRPSTSIKLLPESWQEYFRPRLSQPSTR